MFVVESIALRVADFSTALTPTTAATELTGRTILTEKRIFRDGGFGDLFTPKADYIDTTMRKSPK